MSFVASPSPEQQTIHDDLSRGHNVVVQACPGAGKTTFALQVVSRMSESQRGMLLTYNRALSDATSEKVRKLGCSTFNVFTYHGMLSSMTKQIVNTDVAFVETMDDIDERCAEPQKWHCSDVDILIVDEAQDMRPLFWRLVQFLVRKVVRRPKELQILVMGDKMQLLYDFYSNNSADSRFMTRAPVLFANTSSRPWVERTLSVSYRLTPPAARFVNAVFDTAIKPRPVSNDFPKVSLLVADVYKDPGAIVQKVFSRYLA